MYQKRLTKSSKKIFNRFRSLLSQKSVQEGKVISIREVSRRTSIDATTLSDWQNNKITRYDAKKIAVLCDFFDCTPGDLIVYD